MSAGLIVASVAVAAAIAVYESPELQRMANDLRRRIAIALHAFGDSISPQERENLFNRPEDAEGFLRSRGLGPGCEPGVDADEETRRRQREEIMYWNALREGKEKEKPTAAHEESEKNDEKIDEKARSRSGSRDNFDDFLHKDGNGEKGSYVFNSGAEVHESGEGLVRRRGLGSQALGYSNPFTDMHEIDSDIAFENSLVDPKDEMSDIYSATDLGQPNSPQSATLSPQPHPSTPAMPALVDVETPATAAAEPLRSETPQQTSERELGPYEYMTAGQDDRQDAFSSIQAWAQNSHDTGFYSPLPESPMAPMSEPELVSEDGIMTPTDSGSVSGEDVGFDEANSRNNSQGNSRYYDVMSDDEGTGMMTPASWTEVGSVVSESDGGAGPIRQ